MKKTANILAAYAKSATSSAYDPEFRVNVPLEIRDNSAVRKLSDDDRAEVDAAIERHNARLENRPAPRTPRLLRTRLNEKMEREVFVPVREIMEDNYRTASGRWAGGETDIHVSRSDRPAASGESVRAWSDNGKWSGNDAVLRVTVGKDWRRTVASVPGLADAGGMLTTHARETAPGVWSASWVKQSRGFDLRVESGFIVRCSDGTFAHAKTERAAAQVCKRREAFVRREAKAEKLRGMTREDIAAKFGGVSIIRRDSLRAGNCEPGTDSWIAKHFPGRKSATVAEILAVDSGTVAAEVLSAVKAGIIRQTR